MLARFAAEDVDPDPRRTADHLLRQLRGHARLRFITCLENLLLRFAGVDAHLLGGALRVAGFERIDDRDVALGQPVQVGARRGCGQVGPRERFEYLPQPLDRCISRGS